MKIKTSDLTGHALDRAVVLALGYTIEEDCAMRDGVAEFDVHCFSPSEVWAQGGPILEREKIEIITWKDGWSAAYWRKLGSSNQQDGPTPTHRSNALLRGQQVG